MPTYGQPALVVATSQLGIKEDPPNSNWGPPSKYMKNLGHGPEPWCADFVEWCLEQVGWPRGNWIVAYVPSWVAAAQRGSADMRVLNFPFEQPQPGDLACYDWGKDGVADHIGFYERANGIGSFDAIEGNTSFGNDSNGGEVMRRTRNVSDVTAFIRLPEMPKATLADRLSNAGYGEKTVPVILKRLKDGASGTKPNRNDSVMFRNLRAAGLGAASARKVIKSLRRS